MKLSEFGFRMWYDISECYVENPYIASFHSVDKIIGGQVYHDFGKCPDFVDFDTDSLIIELFSGYYDKNGKKIFEGDIVENQSLNEIYIVTRDKFNMIRLKCYHKFDRKYIQNDKNLELSFFYIYPSKEKMEIIGNIHENPELLKC
ncbi:hypothetical protein CII90_06405 [Campylobacter lari]|nr:hypothetical protein [Campylobacter lari]EID4797088.1 hypothetical protein [Campylobacter lari]